MRYATLDVLLGVGVAKRVPAVQLIKAIYNNKPASGLPSFPVGSKRVSFNIHVCGGVNKLTGYIKVKNDKRGSNCNAAKEYLSTTAPRFAGVDCENVQKRVYYFQQ